MSQVVSSTTIDFVHFDRTGDGRWRVHVRVAEVGNKGDITIEVQMPFIRRDESSIYAAERVALQRAADVLQEILKRPEK